MAICKSFDELNKFLAKGTLRKSDSFEESMKRKEEDIKKGIQFAEEYDNNQRVYYSRNLELEKYNKSGNLTHYLSCTKVDDYWKVCVTTKHSYERRYSDRNTWYKISDPDFGRFLKINDFELG